jgi:hypothetical protein
LSVWHNRGHEGARAAFIEHGRIGLFHCGTCLAPRRPSKASVLLNQNSSITS